MMAGTYGFQVASQDPSTPPEAFPLLHPGDLAEYRLETVRTSEAAQGSFPEVRVVAEVGAPQPVWSHGGMHNATPLQFRFFRETEAEAQETVATYWVAADGAVLVRHSEGARIREGAMAGTPL